MGPLPVQLLMVHTHWKVEIIASNTEFVQLAPTPDCYCYCVCRPKAAFTMLAASTPK